MFGVIDDFSKHDRLDYEFFVESITKIRERCFDSQHLFFLFQMTIPKSQSIRLNGNELIGVTLESRRSVICFAYVNSADMIFRNIQIDHINEPTFPKIGDSYNFETISLLSQWSIWVIIEQGQIFHLLLVAHSKLICELCIYMLY